MPGHSKIDTLKQILRSLNIYSAVDQLKDDDNLFSVGALDSLILIQYVLAIESHFQMRFPNEQITYDNFLSLQKIAKLLPE
jgi:acyl carrier protein